MAPSDAKWPSPYGDPRSAEAIQPYTKPVAKEEDQDPDFRALASLGLGLAGLFTKVRHTQISLPHRLDCAAASSLPPATLPRSPPLALSSEPGRMVKLTRPAFLSLLRVCLL